MNGFVASYADTLSQRGWRTGSGRRDRLLQRRRRPGLRSPRPAVRRLRPLVQLGSGRDLAQPPLRDLRPRRPQPRRPAPQPPADVQPAVVRTAPRRPRRHLALVLLRGRHPAPRRRPLQTRPPRPLRVLQHGQPELEGRARAQDRHRAASFLEDAARGTLPSVSWIDPNFSNFNPIGFQPNDDHAPADIKDGQELVLAVYHALAAGPQWEKTMLVIFYDEHGGFYDHVPPPAAPDDNRRVFGRYGVRVPALIVSPWIEPGSVSTTVFDHTSIIKTILLRFAPDALGQPQTAPRPARPGRPRRAPALPRDARGAGP